MIIPLTKSVIIFSFIVLYCFISMFIGIFPVNRWRLQKWRALLLQKFCRVGLKVMGVKVNFTGDLSHGENSLVVSNHLSYLDILVIASNTPSCFVTSMEIKETPFLGQVTTMGGCLFVERRCKKNIAKEIEELTEGLKYGLNVVIFPEATSTNGESVLRFRRPLYNASIFAKKTVKPVCLNYKKVNGRTLTIKNRDLVFWYDDMPFFSHFVGLMNSSPIEVELKALPPIEIEPMTDAQYLAEESHKTVIDAYNPSWVPGTF